MPKVSPSSSFRSTPTGCRKADGGEGKCGSPKGWLKKAANYKFPKTHPHAYTIFSQLSFTTPQIGQMAALVDIDKMDSRRTPPRSG